MKVHTWGMVILAVTPSLCFETLLSRQLEGQAPGIRPVIIATSGTRSPGLSFADGRELEVWFEEDSEEALHFRELQQAGCLEPLSLASGDFDEDGVPDLAVGYASPDRGFISVLRGNLESFFPGPYWDRPGEQPPPLLSPAQVTEVPESPSLLAAGDFDADGNMDLVFTDKNHPLLWLLAGDGCGAFGEPESIELPGPATSMLAAEVNMRDGLSDLVIAVSTPEGAEVRVFQGSSGAFLVKPEVFPVSAEVNCLTAGRLDTDSLIDVAVGSGLELVLIHGRDRQPNQSAQARAGAAKSRITRRSYASPIASLITGDFVGDSGSEVVLLLDSGELEAVSIEPRLGLWLREISWSGFNHAYPQTFSGPGGPGTRKLLKTKLSTSGKDDILLVDQSDLQAHLIVLKQNSLSGIGFRIDTGAYPVDVLPMRLNQDAFDDLVVLSPSASELTLLTTVAASSFTVNLPGHEPDARVGDGRCDVDRSDPEGADQCTLRAAIQEGNAGEGSFTIGFSIPSVFPEGSLPSITQPVTIDGGGVILNGASQGYGPFDVVGGGSVIQNVVIQGFGGVAIRLREGGNNRIEATKIGTDSTGSLSDPIASGSIVISNSSGNTIGGVSPLLRNVISPARFGEAISITGSASRNNKIIGNYIGTDASGTAALAALNNGVKVSGAVGITLEANLISGNSGFAVKIENSSDLVIRSNRVGTDVSGQSIIANGTYGFWIERSQNMTIGGLLIDQGNLISGNGDRGIYVAYSSGVRIQGNKIGTNGDGTTALPNKNRGVFLITESPSDSEAQTFIQNNVISGNGGHGLSVGQFDGVEITGNKIGTDDTGLQAIPNESVGLSLGAVSNILVKNNIIAFNEGDGIQVDQSGVQKRLTENRIFENAGLGINLCPCGEAPTVPEVTPPGPNNHYPSLRFVDASSGVVKGVVNSQPEGPVTLEFFASDQCDPSGYGEGKESLRSLSNINAKEQFTLTGLPPGKAITATATDSQGNTSEFSACAAEPEIKPFVVNSTGDDPDENAASGDFDGICSTGRKASDPSKSCNPADEGGCECTLRAAIQEANARGGEDSIHFKIDGDAPFTIVPQPQLPAITGSLRLDASTQPNYQGKPIIEVRSPEDPSVPLFGFRVYAEECTIKGFLISNFKTGISLSASYNEIRGNFIGTCSDGQANACGPGFENSWNEVGIRLTRGSEQNIIGGLIPMGHGCVDPCNLISGNHTGVLFEEANDNFLQGNFIGAGITGSTGLSNLDGIQLKSSDENTIGGRRAGEGNLISGNKKDGISLDKSSQNKIQGNLIGTDINGVRDLGNGENGILVKDSSNDNQIGGLAPGSGNVIAFNQEHGIEILLDWSDQLIPASKRNKILSNRIFSNGLFNLLSPNSGQVAELPPRLTTTVQLPENGRTGRTRIQWSDLRTRRSERRFTLQFFSYSCSTDVILAPGAVELIGTVEFTSDPNQYWAHGVSVFPFAVSPDDCITVTATPEDMNTSSLGGGSERPSIDSDGDGIADYVEDEGPNNGDANDNGVPDREEANVASAEVNGNEITLETPAQAMAVAIFLAAAEGEIDEAVFSAGLLDLLLEGLRGENPSALGQRVMADATTVTMSVPPDLRVDSYYNYGPTADFPENHFYEFLYDGSTGAEIFSDRIVVHYVDGQRGDHDLTVNGQIQTRGGPVTRATRFYFPQLGDGTVSDIRFQSGLILNNTGGISLVQMELLKSDASFLELNLSGLGEDSFFEFGLNAGQSMSTQTAGFDELQVGYAEVIGAEGLGGTAVFSRSDADSGTLLYEAGVPASSPMTDFSLFVDTTGHRDTGVALVNPSRSSGTAPAQAADAQVTLRLYDQQFQLIATEAVVMPPGTHLARFVGELFPNQAAQITEMEGSLTVESDQPLVAVTLRQNDDPARSFPLEVPTLTTFPVIPGRADAVSAAQEGEQVFYFPQIGDGTVASIQFQTSLIFINTGAATTVKVEFFDSTGSPMTLDLGTGDPSATFTLSLQSGEALSLQTPGSEELQVGYARVRAGAGVGGTAVFSRTDVSTGTLLYEAGVPAAPTLTDFSLVVDSTGNRETGVALVRPPADGATPAQGGGITLRLYDQQFTLLSEATLELAAGEHRARFVKELFPEVEGIDEMEGSVTIQSAVPIAAVTLRQNDDPALEFPQEVPALTTFPVIPGRSDRQD